MNPNIQLEKSKINVFDKCEVYLIANDIVCVHFFKDVVVEVEDIEQALKAGIEISPDPSTKLIVHMEKFAEITKDSREYVQNNMRELKAEAHVIPSLSYKIMFNLFMKLRKKKHPLKAFDSLTNAIGWISKI